jgi:hypothetical protein
LLALTIEPVLFALHRRDGIAGGDAARHVRHICGIVSVRFSINIALSGFPDGPTIV